MNASGTRRWIASVALIAALAFVVWHHHRVGAGAGPLENASCRPESPAPAPTLDGATAREATASVSPAAAIAARLREWAADDDPEQRDARTAEVERRLGGAGRTIEERLQLIATLPPELMDFAFGLPSFQRWMFAHPLAALDWMREHPGISEARLLTLFQDWGGKDRAALQHYLAALPDGAWKQKATLAAGYEALAVDPRETLEHARGLAAAGPRVGLLEIATAEWARRDPETAARWVSQVGEPALRQRLGGALALGYADIAPELAAGWMAEAGEGRRDALENVLLVWANRDRAAAWAWVQALSDDATRAAATRLVSGEAGP